jgi:hypothetical protein
MRLSRYAVGYGLVVALALPWSDLGWPAGVLLTAAVVAAGQAISICYAWYWQRQDAMTEAERAQDFEDRAM